MSCSSPLHRPVPCVPADGDLDATLFAPTDKAFEALLKQLKLTAAQLLNDTALVQDVLAYHVIPGDALDADDLKNGKSYSTMLKGKKLKVGVGCSTATHLQAWPWFLAHSSFPCHSAALPGLLQIKKNDEGVFVLTVAGQEVPVKIADLEAGDAIVHVIDEVLLPLESEGGKAPAPAPSKPTTPTGDGCTYTVKEGDTLFDIAAVRGACARDGLDVGAAQPHAPFPCRRPHHSPPRPPGPRLLPAPQKYDTTLEDLVALNKQIEDPELILPGDEIKLKEC